MNSRIQKITSIAMLCALAYAAVAVGRIPLVLFLKYDPKDVIIVIGGFIWGPFTSFLISLIVSFIEFVTISDNGPLGLLMNVLSSCSFACTAAFVYKRKRTLSGAVVGLLLGMLMMVLVMLPWNYVVAPIYMHVSRETVAQMLLPAFLPFNLIKGGLNTAVTLLLYKPVTKALRSARLLPPDHASSGTKANVGLILASLAALVTCALFAAALNGIL